MTMEEAEVSEMKNIIVRSVGVEESIEPDLADHEFMSEDILLLCSDGLSRFVQESTVPEIVTHAATLEAACDALIENAKQAGSDDNITCMLIKAIKRSRTEGILSSILPGRDKPKWQDSI
jgi:serine/threonine protein phosphatase PrpC